MSSNTVNPVRKHNRDVWLKIILPVMVPVIGLIGICVALVIAVATDAIEPVQVSIVMGVVSTLCLAIPASLLCLVGCAAMIVVAYGGGWGYRHVRTPVRAVRRMTDTITEKTKHYAPKIARPTMAISVRVARLEHNLRNWIALSEESGGKDSHNDSSR